jgi:hypothetical protein
VREVFPQLQEVVRHIVVPGSAKNQEELP